MFTEKLKRTKKVIISLNNFAGNLTSSVKLAKDELHLVQSLIHDWPLDAILLEK